MSTGSSSWITQKRRLAIYARDDFQCVYCQTKVDFTLDHLKPRSKGGSNKDNNLVTCCHACNSSRGNKPWWEFADDAARVRITKYRRRGMKRRKKLAGRILNNLTWTEVMFFVSSQN